MSAPLVFLDTETDGIHPDRKVWEVAMIRREPDGKQAQTRFFVDIDLSTADPFGLKVGRFYDRHPLGRKLSAANIGDRPTMAPVEPGLYGGDMLNRNAAAMRVARWTHDAHIVGVVPNFDTETLAPLLREAGLTPAWHYHLIDVLALMVGYLDGGGRTDAMPREVREVMALPWKSDELSRVLGVEPPSDERRHTAMGDADWAMRIYDRITGADQVADETEAAGQ